MRQHPTSWHKIGKWYDDNVGEQGHYYHRAIIIPNVLKLLDLKEKSSACLLDLACGQGILSRHLPPTVSYTGLDVAPSLIQAAKSYNKNKDYQFIIADVTKPLPIKKTDFTHATLILALQNIKDPLLVFQNASQHLMPGAKFVIVLNHPCFRIPRQSSWKVDEENKIQYRRIDRYMSPLEIPIQTNPGKGEKSEQSWSFHHPLSAYTQWLRETHFSIESIEEWCSDKVSEGKAAKMENRSRQEIPLFMTLVATKLS